LGRQHPALMRDAGSAAAEEDRWTIYDPAVTDAAFPDDLIQLERSAWGEIQAGTLTVETAHAVQAAITAYAEQAGLARIDVEMGLKKAVRHVETAV